MGATVRAAVVADAPALGRVMVEAWLSAHRAQVPDASWQRRLEEWTPEVSASGWSRLLSEQDPRTLLLVAEEKPGEPVGLLLADEDDDSGAGTAARVKALYVLPGHQGHGLGRLLLGSAARKLVSLGFSRLRVGVLTANAPARAFYEAMGGREVGERADVRRGRLPAARDRLRVGGPRRPGDRLARMTGPDPGCTAEDELRNLQSQLHILYVLRLKRTLPC